MKDTKLSKLFKFIKLVPNFKIRVYFWFMGLGRFSDCGLVYCLFWLRKDITCINIHITITYKPTTYVCAIRVYRVREWWSSLVFLCHGSVYCASIPACQKCASMPEGHPRSVWASLNGFPEVLDVLKAKSLCHCARWLKTHKTVVMAANWFVMLILCVFLSHVMAYWLCLSPLIVIVLVYL